MLSDIIKHYVGCRDVLQEINKLIWGQSYKTVNGRNLRIFVLS